MGRQIKKIHIQLLFILIFYIENNLTRNRYWHIIQTFDPSQESNPRPEGQ